MDTNSLFLVAILGTLYGQILKYVSGVDCHKCQFFGDNGDCNTGTCTGTWCTASIVRDKNQGTINVVKNCAQSHPNMGEIQDNCIQVNTDGVESVICGCNSSHYCNNQSKLDSLLAENTKVFTGSSFDDRTPTKCHLCKEEKCDLFGSICKGRWCTAEIVQNKTTGLKIISKACSPIDSGNGNGCLKLSKGDLETLSCSCNTADFCTSKYSLHKLIRSNTETVQQTTTTEVSPTTQQILSVAKEAAADKNEEETALIQEPQPADLDAKSDDASKTAENNENKENSETSSGSSMSIILILMVFVFFSSMFVSKVLLGV